MTFPCVKHANTKIQIYKYTNTQIQHINSAVKTHHVAYFLKRGLFKDIKKDIPVCQTCKYKNTNTKYQIPNIAPNAKIKSA